MSDQESEEPTPRKRIAVAVSYFSLPPLLFPFPFYWLDYGQPCFVPFFLASNYNYKVLTAYGT